MSVISSKAFVSALRAYHVRVREHKFDGILWADHDSPGGWNPKGVMNHHTVTGPDWSVDRTVQLLWKGSPALPGPLCHVGLDREGVAHLVGWRNANHAGKGDDDVLRAVIAESYDHLVPDENNTDGNPHFYGIEVFNDGEGEPYPGVQLEALFRINAAICDAHGWSAKSCIHHKEWQLGKIDMSWRGDLRKEIARVLKGGRAEVA